MLSMGVNMKDNMKLNMVFRIPPLTFVSFYKRCIHVLYTIQVQFYCLEDFFSFSFAFAFAIGKKKKT